MEQIDFEKFIQELDIRLENYFKIQAEFICCHKGCAECCEKGDYPLSEAELKYLMQGYLKLDYETRSEVQKNIRNLKKGGKCPFLLNKTCSVYPYRPIICRVHGLAYICKNNTVKLPYCSNSEKNYSKVYNNGILSTEPIKENLDTQNLLKGFECGKIQNLYDWIKN